MIFPAFLKKNGMIGISAPSAGVGHKLESFDRSLDMLRRRGFQLKETASVRVNGERGGSAKERGEELNALFLDDTVDLMMAASGGDFLDECLPYVDFDLISARPKFLCGGSDPTGLLYPITTLLDIATIYGFNAGSFDPEGFELAEGVLPDFLEDSLKILQGTDVTERSSKLHLSKPAFLAESLRYDKETSWRSNVGEIRVRGRVLGGCIDCLKDLIGTRYDGTIRFVEKYREDGVIWYFDNFSLSAEVLYRTFLQMDYAGWFDSAKAVIVGRTLFESMHTSMDYEEAIRTAFPKIPVIWEADIGHTIPHMTMINGALADLTFDGASGSGTIRHLPGL